MWVSRGVVFPNFSAVFAGFLFVPVHAVSGGLLKIHGHIVSGGRKRFKIGVDLRVGQSLFV